MNLDAINQRHYMQQLWDSTVKNPARLTRSQLLILLSWHDPNGCYTDSQCDREDVAKLTKDQAIAIMVYTHADAV